MRYEDRRGHKRMLLQAGQNFGRFKTRVNHDAIRLPIKIGDIRIFAEELVDNDLHFESFNFHKSPPHMDKT